MCFYKDSETVLITFSTNEILLVVTHLDILIVEVMMHLIIN